MLDFYDNKIILPKDFICMILGVKNKSLVWILLLTVVIRLVYFIVISITNPDGFYVYDSFGYWQIAESVRTHGAFSQNFSGEILPDYYRTPLYPLFIIFAEFVGTHTLPVIILQIILSAIVVVYTYRTALLLSNERIALLSAIIMAIDVPSIVFSNLIMTETLFSALFIMAVFYFMVYLKLGSVKQLVIASVLVGLAMLCRPIGIFIPLVLGIFLMYHNRKQILKGVQQTLIFAGIILLTISPWLIRNKVQFNRYFLSVIAEHNLQNFQAAVIYAEVLDLPINEARCSLRWNTFNEFEGDVNTQPLEYAHFISKDALEIVKQHPDIALRNQLKQVFHFFVKPTRSYIDIQLGYSKRAYDSITQQRSITEHLLKKSSKLTIALVLFQLLLLAILYLGVSVSFFYFKQQGNLFYWFLFLTIVFCFANLTIPNVTEARFRIPVMPFIAILSACGWYWLSDFFIKTAPKTPMNQ